MKTVLTGLLALNLFFMIINLINDHPGFAMISLIGAAACLDTLLRD